MSAIKRWGLAAAFAASVGGYGKMASACERYVCGEVGPVTFCEPSLEYCRDEAKKQAELCQRVADYTAVSQCGGGFIGVMCVFYVLNFGSASIGQENGISGSGYYGACRTEQFDQNLECSKENTQCIEEFSGQTLMQCTFEETMDEGTCASWGQ